MPSQVAEIKPAAYNPRKISKAQLEALGKAMREFGDLSGIVVNRRTGHLVGGHQRVKHLDPKWAIEKSVAEDSTGTVADGWIQTPWGRIGYREVDWPEGKEKAANLAANKHGGEFDMPSVKELFKSIDIDLDLTGFLRDERDHIIGNGHDGLDDSEDAVPALAKPKTKIGDLYVLGSHRLLCGDATNADHAWRLMEDRRASLMWTDPPYGVSYVGKTKAKKTIQNDGEGDIEGLLKMAFSWANQVLAPGAAIYVAHPPGALSVTFGKAFLFAGWRLHQTLVWVKDSMVLGYSDYHYRHEPIYFGYKNGEGRYGRGGLGWHGRNDETSVFEIPRPKASEDHPTMKPVALVEQMVRNSSETGAFVYDPFSGSGTTLIACERTGRHCFAMEIDPAYCDVVVKRWEKLTGQKAAVKR
jgi:DNA modification methylase